MCRPLHVHVVRIDIHVHVHVYMYYVLRIDLVHVFVLQYLERELQIHGLPFPFDLEVCDSFGHSQYFFYLCSVY